MNKAYDRVELSFIEAVMLKMRFDPRWVNLIMSLIRTVKFAITINGKPGKAFTHSRGIRQVNPLSPYLFLFVSEALSQLKNMPF